MTENRNIRELLEQSEDRLFQQIIDEQEGWTGIEEARHLGGPDADILARWRDHMEKLSSQGRRNWKRIAIIAAIIAVALTITVLAVHIDLLHFIETVQEQFTQFSPSETPESTVAKWLDPYLPAYVPTGYIMSDAVDNGDTKAVEYTNSEGRRFTFYQSGTDTNIRVDTETAEIETCSVGSETGYFVRKNGLSNLHWNTAAASFSIEYNPVVITDQETLRIAESVAKIQNKGEDTK